MEKHNNYCDIMQEILDCTLNTTKFNVVDSSGLVKIKLTNDDSYRIVQNYFDTKHIHASTQSQKATKIYNKRIPH